MKQVFWYPDTTGSYSSEGTIGDEFSYGDEENANPWDMCSLGPYTLPGIVSVKVRRGRKLDVKNPPGAHFATITDRGYKPAKIEVKLTIWKPSHWKQMQDIWQYIEPIAGKEIPKPLDIIHPATAFRKISSVYVADISGPDPSSIRGAMEFGIECEEWFEKPIQKATVTPSKSLRQREVALTAPAVAPSEQSLPGPNQSSAYSGPLMSGE